MKKFINLLCLGLLLLPLGSLAQKKQIKNSNTTLNFTEVWVWTYMDADGNSGEMALYREPTLNYWLLTPDDAGYRNIDEMTMWFIVKPNGEVLQAYQEGENQGRKLLMKHKLSVGKISNLPRYWNHTGKTKNFGDPSLGFPTILGKEYTITYERTNDKTTCFLGSTKADFGALSLFNNLNIDAKLPIRFPQDIPRLFIPLHELATFGGGGSSQYELKYISQGTYSISLTGFTTVRN